jgi:hypothetical protein
MYILYWYFYFLTKVNNNFTSFGIYKTKKMCVLNNKNKNDIMKYLVVLVIYYYIITTIL